MKRHAVAPSRRKPLELRRRSHSGDSEPSIFEAKETLSMRGILSCIDRHPDPIIILLWLFACFTESAMSAPGA